MKRKKKYNISHHSAGVHTRRTKSKKKTVNTIYTMCIFVVMLHLCKAKWLSKLVCYLIWINGLKHAHTILHDSISFNVSRQTNVTAEWAFYFCMRREKDTADNVERNESSRLCCGLGHCRNANNAITLLAWKQRCWRLKSVEIIKNIW